MASLIRGPEGSPLPDEADVFRLLREDWLPMDFPFTRRVGVQAFTLSSADRAHSPAHLSVYAIGLTTPAQAWELLGAKPHHSVAAFLNVAQVREITPDDVELTASLDVIWTEAAVIQDGEMVPDRRPGSEGHAGIAHLDHPSLTKLQRKVLRSKLADLAETRLEYVREASGDGSSGERIQE